MRATRLFLYSLLVLAGLVVQSAKPDPVRPAPAHPQAGRKITGALFDLHAAQVRTPETVPGQPGTWPQQGARQMVDVTQLKMEAQELTTLTNGLPAQMDQIGKGRLPKELIESLKKIEKLAKHIRGEIS